jgi:hypothetical protein
MSTNRKQTLIFSLQGSVSCEADTPEQGAEAFRELIRKAGRLAEECGFRVFFMNSTPEDDDDPGFRSNSLEAS